MEIQKARGIFILHSDIYTLNSSFNFLFFQALFLSFICCIFYIYYFIYFFRVVCSCCFVYCWYFKNFIFFLYSKNIFILCFSRNNESTHAKQKYLIYLGYKKIMNTKIHKQKKKIFLFTIKVFLNIYLILFFWKIFFFVSELRFCMYFCILLLSKIASRFFDIICRM